MKRSWICFLLLTLLGTLGARAQDAATEERLNKLSGKIEDLIAAQEAQRRQITELAREIQSLRDELGKPGPEFASQDDLRRLADAVREVDRKRLEDYERIRAELLKLGKTVATSASAPSRDSVRERSAPAERGFEYVIQKGDTISVIVQAYREQNIMVTVDQVLKANKGLVPERLQPGQKIFIPAP